MKYFKLFEKNICKSIFVGSVLLALGYFTVGAEDLNVSAKSAILICADSGSEVWSKNKDESLPMASTTKIMTALLALEQSAACGNKEVEITPEMVRVEGTSMGLMPGDIVNLEALAKGMLLCSGNDAANAAAVAIAGDEKRFIDLMNEKAHSIGMKNTKFSTPSGLDKDNHHSTAKDMALLGSYAMENEDFADIVCKKSMQVKFINPFKTVNIKNHNKLLRLFPDCIGIKTGFTKSAGRCLVSCASRNGAKLVCVTLNAPSDWDDHIKLYNYGFENIVFKNFNDKNFKSSLKIRGGTSESVDIAGVNEFSVSLKPGEESKVIRKEEIPEIYNAPVEKGQIVGKVVYCLEDRVIGKNDIIVCENVPEFFAFKRNVFSGIRDFFGRFFGMKSKRS